MAHQAFVALGSNLGDRLEMLQKAVQLLEQVPSTELELISSVYETEPVGRFAEESIVPFLNLVLSVKTMLSPEDLLSQCLQIEQALGRHRTLDKAQGQDYRSRTLDMDLLLYDDCIIQQPNLEIPHPRLHERAFVLVPLAEIASSLVHPSLGQTIQQLKEQVSSSSVLFSGSIFSGSVFLEHRCSIGPENVHF